jgi:hypothetical protein
LRGEGEPGSGWPSYSPKDYARLGFYFVGLNMESNFVLALDEPPVYFPHGADVVVFGCPAEDFIQARAVILIDEDGYTVIHSSKFPWGCNSP